MRRKGTAVMGASNALSAYRLYASKVPATSLSLLAYMALVAKDKDEAPWWSQGHGVLAAQALGRPEPVTAQDEQADERAVRRAITPLFAAGAITAIRKASGHPEYSAHVRYRLWLMDPAPDAERRAGHRSLPDGKRPKRHGGVGRKVVERRTESGRQQDGNRPTKDREETEELFNDEEETRDRRTPRTGSGGPPVTIGHQIDGAPADPEAERRRQQDALMALINSGPADPS